MAKSFKANTEQLRKILKILILEGDADGLVGVRYLKDILSIHNRTILDGLHFLEMIGKVKRVKKGTTYKFMAINKNDFLSKNMKQHGVDFVVSDMSSEVKYGN
jgi:hypothetical protein